MWVGDFDRLVIGLDSNECNAIDSEGFLDYFWFDQQSGLFENIRIEFR